jgi:uncharacterized surface protein with fasciclin (FAS1) repeats
MNLVAFHSLFYHIFYCRSFPNNRQVFKKKRQLPKKERWHHYGITKNSPFQNFSMKFQLASAIFSLSFAQVILDEILDSSEHSIFAGLISIVPPITNVLANQSEQTLIAPTNEAFKKMNQKLLDQLKYDGVKLREFLMMQIVPETIVIEDVNFLYPITLLDEQRIVFKVVGNDAKISAGLQSATVQKSIPVGNGIIHSVDTVILPPSKPLDLIKEMGDTSFLVMLTNAGLYETFTSFSGTMLVPNNDAIKEMKQLLRNQKIELTQDLSANIIKLHLISKPIYSGETNSVTKVETLSSNTLDFTFNSDSMYVRGPGNQVIIQTPDIIPSTGVIMSVKNVLLPAGIIEPISTTTAVIDTEAPTVLSETEEPSEETTTDITMDTSTIQVEESKSVETEETTELVVVTTIDGQETKDCSTLLEETLITVQQTDTVEIEQSTVLEDQIITTEDTETVECEHSTETTLSEKETETVECEHSTETILSEKETETVECEHSTEATEATLSEKETGMSVEETETEEETKKTHSPIKGKDSIATPTPVIPGYPANPISPSILNPKQQPANTPEPILSSGSASAYSVSVFIASLFLLF